MSDQAPCRDCGASTAPRDSAGDIMDFTWEWYVVWPRVWRKAVPDAGEIDYGGGGYLCVGCLEARLGRRLRPGDFADVPANLPSALNTPRLQDRLGVQA